MKKKPKKSRRKSLFKNSTILITGGTGSLGHQLVRTILPMEPERLIIFSRDEYKQFHMEREFNDPRLRFFIGDVRDRDRLWRAMNGVDYVIHAAALKQVPICEYNPFEAVQTNVMGAMNVIGAALDRGVKKVVALSTDKAVNPINLYGATKLCSDKLFISGNAYAGASGTLFSVVRYGNVANSRGSVIPHFRDLAGEGNVLPVTDKRMTRFYITLDQGVALVLKAFDVMRGGEIFVSKIPSFRIVDLVEAFGCVPHEIGIRPGEKLHEVMITTEDSRLTFDYGTYYVIYPQFEWWDSVRHFIPWGTPVDEGFVYSSISNKEWLSVDALRKAINQ